MKVTGFWNLKSKEEMVAEIMGSVTDKGYAKWPTMPFPKNIIETQQMHSYKIWYALLYKTYS